MVGAPPEAVAALAERLVDLGWVRDLLVAGSLATGDYDHRVSDLDLVAVVAGPVDEVRTADLVRLHQDLDRGSAAGARLGCVYVDEDRLPEPAARHATWTHGRLVDRILSGVTRAELVLHGCAVFGRPPGDVLAPMGPDQVRAAARAELVGYWAWAARRPHLWLDRGIADLGLTSMARGRSALRTGQLLTKTDAIEQAAAPPWLRDQLRARRRGEAVVSPRLRTGWIAWRDARATTRAAARIRL